MVETFDVPNLPLSFYFSFFFCYVNPSKKIKHVAFLYPQSVILYIVDVLKQDNRSIGSRSKK